MTDKLTGKFNADPSSVFAEMEKALRRRDLEALLSLLQQGADINQTDHNNNTPLILASINGDFALAQLLISKGADLERRNNNGSTALMLATANRRADVVRLLIEAGVDIHKNDNDHIRGYGTALQWAEKEGYEEIAQILRSVPEIRRHVTVAVKQFALKDLARTRKVKIKPGRPNAGP